MEIEIARNKTLTGCYFIPARGGSKRIPRKNLQKIDGVPLLLWPFREAEILNLPVFVSTEDPEIAELAREHNGNILDRPAELAADHIRWEMLDYHIRRGEMSYDLIGMRQCNCPFLHPETAKKCFRIAGREECCVMTAYHEMTKIDLRKTGALYVIPRNMILTGEYLIEEDWILQPTGYHESFDIDEPEDLERAREIVPEIL